jgi:hypothetical protein
MFGDYNIQSVVATFDYDPASDKTIPIFRAPHPITVVGCYATVATAIASDGSNYFAASLKNGSDVVGEPVGGVDTAWVALTPKSMTIDEATAYIDAGEVLSVLYDETGTGTFGQLTIQIDYVHGKA